MIFLFLACRSSTLSVCAQFGQDVFLEVPAGVFWMGEVGVEPYTVPLHTVGIAESFCLAQHETTQRLYQRIMNKNPSKHKGEEHPVENITWYDALEFSNAWSIEEGLKPCYSIGQESSETGANIKDITLITECTGFRLPTEAEWEWAARHGRGGHVLKQDFDAEVWTSKAKDLKQNQRVYAGGKDLEQHVFYKKTHRHH